MTCRELADFLMDYLSGDLAESERAAFERHLSLCINCVEYLRQYEATIQAGRGAFADPEDDVPIEVPEQLVQAILTARRSTS